MGGVFVNYRTGDGDWAATFISRELAAEFGSANVFFASKSIRVGEDFVIRILDRLRQCEVFLAVIGPRWLTATDRNGRPRLDNPEDWVRREILAAFRGGLRVIPVFLDGTPALNEADLPDDIKMLARCQYLRLHHRNDDRDIARVLDELTEILSAREAPADAATLFKKALADRDQAAAVRDIFQDTTSQTLEALREARYPVSMPLMADREVPAALAERIESYQDDMAQLLRFAVLGVASGISDYDALWVRAVERLLNRAGRRSRGGPWAAAEAYPTLLLSYVIGIASAASGRDEVAYRSLVQATVTASGTPAIQALALRNVIDPKYVAEFPEWNGVRHYHALSRHVRVTLRPFFAELLDDHEYEAAFEEYEYLRTLLELHDMAFSSLGEFAFQLSKGQSNVHKRMTARLTAESAALKAGAFDGAVANVTTARHQLDASIQGRYS
ncbi:hypothetical protein JOF56_001969 [Kibdelosporangium banguiense]|uniref:TIR domain-containing protein n=1 Tax=Kibdelosporangium banguiense TaxID=1365924 RepID=A0ABS4TAZ6_9PSEU|nr:toll/interleukin-1 receptor domain-containing protein [Kibdelosporangium banguiense]MBP2321584.1 hypothetical protein [Kibdelosporangium banguiense]